MFRPAAREGWKVPGQPEQHSPSVHGCKEGKHPKRVLSPGTTTNPPSPGSRTGWMGASDQATSPARRGVSATVSSEPSAPSSLRGAEDERKGKKTLLDGAEEASISLMSNVSKSVRRSLVRAGKG